MVDQFVTLIDQFNTLIFLKSNLFFDIAIFNFSGKLSPEEFYGKEITVLAVNVSVYLKISKIQYRFLISDDYRFISNVSL